MQPEVFSSGYIIFRKEAVLEFLLMKHADRWDLPKGHLDAGETREQAALRELHEETGIEPSAIWHDPVFRYVNHYHVSYKRDNKKPRLKELTIFMGFLLRDQTIQPTEHPDYRWWRWNPPHLIQPQTIDPLLEKVAAHIQQVPQWPNIELPPVADRNVN